MGGPAGPPGPAGGEVIVAPATSNNPEAVGLRWSQVVLGLGAVAAAGYATRGAWLPSVRGVIYDTASAAYRALLAPTAMDLDDDGPPAAPPAGKAQAQAAVEEPPPKPETRGFAVRFAGPVPAGRASAGRPANGHESGGSGLSTLESDSEGSDGLDLVSAGDLDSSPPTKVDLETALEDLEAACRQIDGRLAAGLGPGLEADALKTALEKLEAASRLLGGSDSESESDGSVPSLASDSEDELEAQEAPQAASQEERGPPRGHADWRDWEALPATVLAVVARKIAAATDASYLRRPKSIICEAGSVDSGELFEPLSSADAECAHGLLPFALVCKAWRQAQLMVGKLRMRTGDVVAEDKVGLLLWALGDAGAPASMIEAYREEMTPLFQTEGQDLINPDGTLRDPRQATRSFLAKVRDIVGGRVRPMTLV